MTLAEIARRLDRYLGGESTREFYTAQTRLDAINDAQRQVADDLLIPKRFVNVVGAPPLSLPTEASGAGLISIKVVENTGARPLPLYTVTEANQRFPQWSEEETGTQPARYVIYDPANLTAPIYVVPPHTDTRTYRIEYRPRVNDFTLSDLDTGTAVPFNGDVDFEGAHELIPLYAAALLWDMQKDDLGYKQYTRYMNEYMVKAAEYYHKINGTWVVPENDFFRSFRRR